MVNNYADMNLEFIRTVIKHEQTLLLLLQRDISIDSSLIAHYSSVSAAFPNLRDAAVLYAYTLKKYLLNKKLNKPTDVLLYYLDLMSEELPCFTVGKDGYLFDPFGYIYAMEALPFEIDFTRATDSNSFNKLVSTYGIDDLKPPHLNTEYFGEDYFLNTESMYDMYAFFTFTIQSKEIDLYLDKHFGNKNKEDELISFIHKFCDFIAPDRYTNSTIHISKYANCDNSTRYTLHFAVTDSCHLDSYSVTLGFYEELLATSSEFADFLSQNI